MPRVQLPTGVSLYYEWHGDHDGCPVVFIRGTGADGSRWLPQVEAYTGRYRCLIFDNRGAGQSDGPHGAYTVELMGLDALGLLDKLGVDRAHISGLSLGGAIAQFIAAEAPERVATLQLHGSWGRTYGYARMYLSLLKRFVETGGLELYYEGALLYLFPPEFFIEQYERAMEILSSMKEHSSPIQGLLGQLEANLTHDLSGRLKDIIAPTLITVGEFDMCLPPYYSRELHEAIPGSELIVFNGGSHLFGLQDPDTFNRVTLAWLDRQVAAMGAGEATAERT